MGATVPAEPTPGRAVTIRARRRDDLPVLGDALLAQQPSSGYPLRDPLPFPVEEFLHRDDADAAWVAELDGRPVGHVCRTRARPGADAAAANDACARALGCPVEDLGWVSSLFVGLEGRGLGIGRRLLEAVVADLRRAGLGPCLEVVPAHDAALRLYTSSGWREVARVRPPWLRETLGDQGPDVRVMVLPGPVRPVRPVRV
jgi:GNAT superfamily N-acetyltransferase